MECVEAALKTSFRKEMGVRQSPQVVFDDLLDVNVQNVVDFSVDDLLNFSDDDDGFVVVEEQDQDDDKDLSSPSQEQNQPAEEEALNDNNNPSTSLFVSSVPTTELTLPVTFFFLFLFAPYIRIKKGTFFFFRGCVLWLLRKGGIFITQAEELENLEWLSHFVEESFSEFSTSYHAGVSAEKPPEDEPFLPEPTRFVPEKPCFTTPIPAKARSKRARTGGRVWSLGSPSFIESSSSSTTSSSSSSSPTSPWLINATQSLEPACSVEKPAPKKAKKRQAVESFGSGSGPASAQPPRRCSHCGVQKTPQWRTGPLGAKTLCNACGVRFKSGRLLPEYRPACSPTFSSDLHSNHHRKVLEMRRKKESVTLPPESVLGPPVVSSF